MKARDIKRFFQELDKRISVPLEVVLTGGAAGILQGVNRATQDIDFELHFKKAGLSSGEIEAVQNAILMTGRQVGIIPQYAEDIDRWSAIALPEKRSFRYAVIGKIDVRVLEPGLWAIGKLTRALASDFEDLTVVLKGVNIEPLKLAKLWGRALGLSPASNQLVLFRRQVEGFFDDHSRTLWPRANAADLKKAFLAAAGAANKKNHPSGSKR